MERSMNYDVVFGPHAFRLQGVAEAALPALGRVNHLRLVGLVEQNLVRGDLEQPERAEALAALGHLRALAEDAPVKPMLPLLRAGVPMVEGSALRVYLGDTPGEPEPWVRAVVVRVVKDFKKDWAAERDGGYYWRVVARTDAGRELALSSSEPRAIPEADLAYLTSGQDSEFREIYCRNATKNWQPIWCIEAGVVAPVASMDLDRWLTALE
jgi:hypothetical protein